MYHQEQSGAKFSVKFLIDEWKKSDKNWRVTVAKKKETHTCEDMGLNSWYVFATTTDRMITRRFHLCK